MRILQVTPWKRMQVTQTYRITPECNVLANPGTRMIARPQPVAPYCGSMYKSFRPPCTSAPWDMLHRLCRSVKMVSVCDEYLDYDLDLICPTGENLLSVLYKKGGVAVRRRRPQPLPAEGCNVLQEETPQTLVWPDKSDAQAAGGERSKAQAHAQHSSARA